jgi:hypothetical protein
MRIRTLLIAAVICCSCGALRANAQVTDDRESLRGLKGVGLFLQMDKEEMERFGLSLSLITTDVELRLRKAGIRVLEGKEADDAKGWPHLVPYISIIDSGKGVTAYVIEVRMLETVYLKRYLDQSETAKPLCLTTWNNAREEGMVDSRAARDVTRKALGDALDKFINDYLAVNPKP